MDDITGNVGFDVEIDVDRTGLPKEAGRRRAALDFGSAPPPAMLYSVLDTI